MSKRYNPLLQQRSEINAMPKRPRNNLGTNGIHRYAPSRRSSFYGHTFQGGFIMKSIFMEWWHIWGDVQFSACISGWTISIFVIKTFRTRSGKKSSNASSPREDDIGMFCSSSDWVCRQKSEYHLSYSLPPALFLRSTPLSASNLHQNWPCFVFW